VVGQRHLYVLALGSNRSLSATLTPRRLLEEAASLIGSKADLLATAPLFDSAPLGPSLRRYANSALLIESTLTPPAMLAFVQGVEARLGRRRHRRWGARTMDIDIILWSGGTWSSRTLAIPHPAFRARAFVLDPARTIVPDWRDPYTGLAVRHLHARLQKAKAKVDHRPRRH
jgi:2-amino-4-hydroxy-6-hydroxymethyldihydropteridine diphosphokinase